MGVSAETGAESWARSGAVTEALAPVVAARQARRRLADLLEEIADDLPDAAGPAAMAAAADMLRRLAESGGGEDERFADYLVATVPPGDPRREPIRAAAALALRERLSGAHRALELAEALEGLKRAKRSQSAGELGYMLRAWFEAERLRLDWERAALLAPGCGALSDDALIAFAAARTRPMLVSMR